MPSDRLGGSASGGGFRTRGAAADTARRAGSGDHARGGLSRRRFGELFREQVGATPKLYCRLRRFQEVVRRATTGSEIDWTDVAVAGGYCDQAHLAHEFRNFSGLTPGEYAAADRPFANHVPIE